MNHSFTSEGCRGDGGANHHTVMHANRKSSTSANISSGGDGRGDLCDEETGGDESPSSNHRFNQQKLGGSQRHSINDIAQEVKQRYGSGSIDTGNVCDLCKKTKFSNSTVGHACFHCKARACIRCSFKFTHKNQVTYKFFIGYNHNLNLFIYFQSNQYSIQSLIFCF